MKFNEHFAEVPRLETERLILRPFRSDDAVPYLRFIRSPEVRRYIGGAADIFLDTDDISNWLHNINGRLLKSKTVLTWCVELKSEGSVVGRVDLGGFLRKSMAELAYYFSPEHWGKGIATEAVGKVVRFGFDELKLHRIQATVMPQNTASLKVLEHSGFMREGMLRKYDFGREFHDVLMLSAIREENL